MIISAAILLLILIPITLSVVLSVPSVQNFVARQAARIASNYLGATVSIGHIDVTMSGGVELRDLLVNDLQADTMLFAKRVESRISIFSPMSRNLRFGRSSLSGGELHLRARELEDGSVEMNIRQIALLLAGRGKAPMEISIEGVVVDDLRVSIEQLTHNNPSYGVDMRNLELSDISGSVAELSISGSSVHAYVERFSGVERSGFELNNLTGELYLTDGAISVTDMILDSRWSSLKINHLMLVAASWRDYREFERNTYLDIDIDDGTLASDDLAYFVPSIRDWGVRLYDMNLSAAGEVNRLALGVNNISYGESTNLSLNLSVEGLPHLEESLATISALELETNALDLDQLKWSISGRGFSESLLSNIESMGDISLYGSATGYLHDLDTEFSLSSDIGGGSSTMHILSKDNLALSGSVTLTNLDLGTLLGDEKLGLTTISTKLNGAIDGARSEGDIESHIESIEFDDKRFEEIYLAGSFGDGDAKRIEVVSRDPRVDLELLGSIKSLLDPAKVKEYDFDLNLRNIDLKALDINRRDTTSRLTAHLRGVGGGDDIESCWGRVDLTQGEYYYNSDTLSTSNMMLDMISEEGVRRITFKSDFGDMLFSSSSRVSHIIDYLQGAVVRYLPSLYDDPDSVIESISRAERGSDSSLSQLTVRSYDADQLMDAINNGLKIGDGSELRLSFDPHTHNIDLDLSTSYLERGTTMALDLDLSAEGRGDSLTMRGGIGELSLGTSFIEGARIDAIACRDRVNLDGGFANPLDSASVRFGAIVGVANSEVEGRSFDIEVLPSQLSRRNMEWSVSSPSIKIIGEGVDIDNFRIENADQLMTINGRASHSTEDRVVMTMHDFDLSIFSTLIKQLGYNIEGRTNGEATLSSVLSGGRFDAKVELDNVSVNTLKAPPMRLTTEWDSRSNRARLFLADRISTDTLIRGYYIPSEIKYYAMLDVDSLQMGILDPPLGGVIHSTTGHADLSLALMGERRDAHLNGQITAYGVETTIGYTNVRYEVPQVTINVVDNMLRAKTAPISHLDEDRESFESHGEIDLEVDLQHLSNIGYRVRVTPRELQVLNTTERDNDLFYGEVYTSGVVDIVGDKSGVKMNIIAESADNSQFFMPLTSKSNISTVDFITFTEPTKIDTTDISELKRQVLTRQNRVRGTGNMEINMSLDIKPNLDLQLVIDPTVGDIIKAKGEGNLNLQIEPKSNLFDIYGDYTITEGSYLFTLRNIVNKRFVIDPGSSIQWTGAPADPILDINAIYKLRTSLQPIMSDESTTTVPVNCIINLSNRLTRPDVAFSIEIPSSDAEQQAALSNLLNDQESVSRQFFYLVLANTFISDSSTGGASDIGVSTTTATGFELLTNQLSNWLSTNNYNVVIRYRPESELMGEEVDFGFSRGLINNRLLVELEGNYIIDNKQAISEDASNFLGEAYITWLIDRAGALKLRGFTQTIDRFDENQGLQETGMGIYYRENFDNFKDLRDRVRARFQASDERKAKRENRRESKQTDQKQ